MTRELTANEIGGRAIGALFLAGFGALWLCLGLYAKELLTAGRAALVASGAALLVAGALALVRRSKRLPRRPDDPAMARAFKWINAAQWAAIAVVAFTFARLGINAYVVSAIAAVVGLHMFPLARLFHYPLHHVTGAVLVAWAAASVVIFSRGEMQGATAVGTGIILWMSALVTLVLAMRDVRQRATLASEGPIA